MRTLFAPIALALGAAGCGWSRGLVAPEAGATVGVEVFRGEHGVLERGLEVELHEELCRAVVDLVHARLVPPERADWVVRGTIASFRRRGGIRSRDNELRETALRLDLTAELAPRDLPAAGPPSGPAPAPPPEPDAADAVARSLAPASAQSLPAAPRSRQAAGAVPPAPRATEVRVWSGYGLDVPTNEAPARRRALRFLAESIVLDLFAEPLPPER